MSEYYEHMKADVNNLSYWFPKIEEGVKKSGVLSVPATFFQQVPEDIYESFYLDSHNKPMEYHMMKIFDWVKDELYPNIPASLHRPIFIKNGAFSNKFDFKTCAVLCSPIAIASAIIDINYTSLCFDTGGNSEIVIRERIMADLSKVPTIYNGMPMRTEFRVFYDFDDRKVLYCHNYWDYDYCYPSISQQSASDAVVFEKFHARYDEKYVQHREEVMDKVASVMQWVDGLTGPWSVDIMMDETGEMWLIDMATAWTSAYWNPERAGEKYVKKTE